MRKTMKLLQKVIVERLVYLKTKVTSAERRWIVAGPERIEYGDHVRADLRHHEETETN